MSPRSAVACLLIPLIVVVTACEDDGNDRAMLEARRERQLQDAGRTLADSGFGLGGNRPAGSSSDASSSSGDSGSSAESANQPPATGDTVEVIALDNSFRPQQIEIAVGDAVMWENRGINEHNVLSVEGEGWGVEVEDFAPGATYSHVFTEPGEYRYYCSIHGSQAVGMVGTVIVSE